MSEILDAAAARAETVAAAVAALQAGELVVLPTDTLYGVAADAFNPAATAKIFAAKQRSNSLPLPVLIRSQKQLLGLVTKVPEAAERLMAAYWPGPVTIVVEHDPNLEWDLGAAKGAVAVRMPFDDVTLEIIRSVGPIACTSANLSGKRPAPTAQEAHEQLGDAVAVYVDAGERTGLSASTIIDCTRSEPHVLREGPIPGGEALEVARGERDLMSVTVIDGPANIPADTALEVADAVDAAASSDRDVLLSVAGMGPAKADAILSAFDNLAGIRTATDEQLGAVKGVGPALIAKVRAALT